LSLTKGGGFSVVLVLAISRKTKKEEEKGRKRRFRRRRWCDPRNPGKQRLKAKNRGNVKCKKPKMQKT